MGFARGWSVGSFIEEWRGLGLVVLFEGKPEFEIRSEETLKDLAEEAKRRTIVVAILVLNVASIMSCLKVHHNVNSNSPLVKINFI
jgi:hypothetical protein